MIENLEPLERSEAEKQDLEMDTKTAASSVVLPFHFSCTSPEHTAIVNSHLTNPSNYGLLSQYTTRTLGLQPSPSVELEGKELWEKFNAIGTEMILTKGGRRMFPEFGVKVTGLDPSSLYILCAEAVPVDNSRYKWHSTDGWKQGGKGETCHPTRAYIHPDSPAPGRHWMSQPVTFNKLKVTNNMLDQHGHFVLHSMHKYQLRLCIVLTTEGLTPTLTPYHIITFPETAFIAVTSYQNPKMSQLKIETNPFAKGIKDSKLHKQKEHLKSPQKRPHKDEKEVSADIPELKKAKLQNTVPESIPETLETSTKDKKNSWPDICPVPETEPVSIFNVCFSKSPLSSGVTPRYEGARVFNTSAVGPASHLNNFSYRALTDQLNSIYFPDRGITLPANVPTYHLPSLQAQTFTSGFTNTVDTGSHVSVSPVYTRACPFSPMLIRPTAVSAGIPVYPTILSETALGADQPAGTAGDGRQQVQGMIHMLHKQMDFIPPTSYSNCETNASHLLPHNKYFYNAV
ncbi:T-box transcription factor TBX6-like [Protopterus annectens]|uniref:T-box transcription factor TBX6-like n=1 Tax=Protopterus annectens TaxID=7888 RepID=UPI001CFAAA59|nr:T-box transcription factor TBX6-like [Protopterus annectens]